MSKKKSLYDEIIESLELDLHNSKTDKHYENGALGTSRSAVHHALASALGNVKAIKEARDRKPYKHWKL